MVAILEKRDLRDFDWLTALLALAIAAFGVWPIHNALPTEGYWSKQIYGIGIAIVAFIVVSFADFRRNPRLQISVCKFLRRPPKFANRRSKITRQCETNQAGGEYDRQNLQCSVA